MGMSWVSKMTSPMTLHTWRGAQITHFALKPDMWIWWTGSQIWLEDNVNFIAAHGCCACSSLPHQAVQQRDCQLWHLLVMEKSSVSFSDTKAALNKCPQSSAKKKIIYIYVHIYFFVSFGGDWVNHIEPSAFLYLGEHWLYVTLCVTVEYDSVNSTFPLKFCLPLIFCPIIQWRGSYKTLPGGSSACRPFCSDSGSVSTAYKLFLYQNKVLLAFWEEQLFFFCEIICCIPTESLP